MTLKIEEGQLTSTTSSLSHGNKGWIRALISFVKHHQLQSEEEFEDTSIEEFNKFRLTTYNTEAYLRPSNSPNYNRSNSKPKAEDNALFHSKGQSKRTNPNTMYFEMKNTGIVGICPPRQLHVYIIVRKFSMKRTFQMEVKKQNYSLRNKYLCMQCLTRNYKQAWEDTC